MFKTFLETCYLITFNDYRKDAYIEIYNVELSRVGPQAIGGR